MSPWSIAIGNIEGSNPPPVVFEQADAAAPAVEQKPAPPERPTCPHCGAPMKLPNGPKPWAREEDAALIDMLRAGKPRRTIAEALDRPPSSVGSRINTLELRS